MSWTDVFPVLTEEQVDDYLALASREETGLLDEWFGVDRIINPRRGVHLVATSLFWKGRFQSEPELSGITRETMLNASALGLVSVFPPWTHYVQPLLDGALILQEARPDVVFRVYLAADLEFLVEDLVAVGCEVALMRSSSLRHNPGAMWRFLALGEEGRLVTITDADRVRSVMHDVERTEVAVGSGYGLWRVPYFFGLNKSDHEPTCYKAINACHFGAAGGCPVERMMKAFVWHTMRGTMPDTCTVHGNEKVRISGTSWPDYGFDEWFLIAAVYPRMAFDGVLTFVAWNDPLMNHWFALDIEYVTVANSKSTILYFDTRTGRIPETSGETRDPWAGWENPESLKVRPETAVVRRRRKRIGPAQAIFDAAPAREMVKFPQITGGLAAALAWADEGAAAPWWVDLDPQLGLSGNGGEIFLDRRYDTVDLVFCGYYFLTIDAATAAWAKGHGLSGPGWGEGKLLKVPKLEGPMTLWRLAFSRAFQPELAALPEAVRGEVLMKAWMERGRVVFAETTAGQMGWRVR
ncbi:MAG: hypothetical protein JWO82_1829 [Akkermansiaceae bacterium]|nr:hypothetical protein [Akkermansiaceae bacterium]